ncbi:MAG: membrane protein insertion efficiency factor YidD [Myxococcaceae bacterium]
MVLISAFRHLFPLPKKIAVFLIRSYQRLISPLIGPRCRFYPTCSEYGKMAFEKHNFAFACFLTIKRLLRCQPLCEGGFDPVPEKKNDRKQSRTGPLNRC